MTLPLWALVAVPERLSSRLGGALFVARRRGAGGACRSALAPEPGETKERAAARVDRALREALARRYGVPEGASAPPTSSPPSPERGLPAAQLDGRRRRSFRDVDFLRFAPQLGDYDARIRELRERAARRPAAARLSAPADGPGPSA